MNWLGVVSNEARQPETALLRAKALKRILGSGYLVDKLSRGLGLPLRLPRSLRLLSPQFSLESPTRPSSSPFRTCSALPSARTASSSDFSLEPPQHSPPKTCPLKHVLRARLVVRVHIAVKVDVPKDAVLSRVDPGLDLGNVRRIAQEVRVGVNWLLLARRAVTGERCCASETATARLCPQPAAAHAPWTRFLCPKQDSSEAAESLPGRAGQCSRRAPTRAHGSACTG